MFTQRLKQRLPAIGIFLFTILVISGANRAGPLPGMFGLSYAKTEAGWPFVSYRYEVRRETLPHEGTTPGYLRSAVPRFGREFTSEEYMWPAFWANVVIALFISTATALGVESLAWISFSRRQASQSNDPVKPEETVD